MASGNDSSGSDSFFFLMLFVVIGIFLVVINNFHFLAFIWKWIRIAELSIFYFAPDWFPIYGNLEVQRAFHWLLETPATDLMPETILQFDGHYLRWLTWLPGIAMIWWGVKRIKSTAGVTSRHDMERLIKKFVPLYPHLESVVDAHPEKKPILYKRDQPDTHQWAMSLSPKDFSLLSPPLGLERIAKKDKSYRSPIWDGKEDFDMDLAEKAFIAQLGSKFVGIDALKDHERRVFDTLVDRLSVEQDLKVEMFNKIARSILSKKGLSAAKASKLGVGYEKLYIYTNDLVEKKKKSRKGFDVKKFLRIESISEIIGNESNKTLQDIFKLIYAEEIMGQHAFVRVGLMSLLERSRDSGVFATDNVKWLKQEDRTLWYCLSSVGRKVSFVESAGCFAHWLIEKQIGRPISHPEVTEAVQGLYKALKLDKVED